MTRVINTSQKSKMHFLITTLLHSSLAKNLKAPFSSSRRSVHWPCVICERADGGVVEGWGVGFSSSVEDKHDTISALLDI